MGQVLGQVLSHSRRDLLILLLILVPLLFLLLVPFLIFFLPPFLFLEALIKKNFLHVALSPLLVV